MKRGLTILAAVVVSAGMARATTLYSNGFENPTDVNDFSPSGNITRVASGGGTLGLTASSGNYYAEITNSDGDYQPGYGDSTYTFYGSEIHSSDFSESVDYYLNTNWASPTNPSVPAFWIDSAPSDAAGLIADGDVADGQDPISDEVNFQISEAAPGTLSIAALGSNPVATITSSGWYTFTMTFQPGTSGFVENILSVSDHSGNVLGTYTNQSLLPNADLGGTGYGDWTTVWQNGFAGDTLGIDNVHVTAAVPLPASAWSGLALLGGLATLGGFKRRRRHLA